MEGEVVLDGNLKITSDGDVFFRDGNEWHKKSFENVRSPYYTVSAKVDGRRKAVSVHRLVATYFVPNPEGKPYVNHIDGNKRNNKASNLEWVTQSENLKHAIRIGLIETKPYVCECCGQKTRIKECLCTSCRIKLISLENKREKEEMIDKAVNYIKTSDLPVRKLAALLDVWAESIYSWRNEERKPSESNARKIIRTFEGLENAENEA